MYKILKAEQLTANIFLMDVEAPRVARHCLPGQFIIAKMDEEGERIPLTICDYDREAGTITIVFQPVGASTTKMKELKAGDYFRDFTGPLGNASELVEEDIEELKKKKILFVGGGVGAAPVVTPNIGIVASTDILAADQASVDLVYALKDSDHKDLVERIETRHGLRQLSYMKEMHMGNDRYHLINIDEDDKEILPADAVKNVKPFQG
mgnify:FL=1